MKNGSAHFHAPGSMRRCRFPGWDRLLLAGLAVLCFESGLARDAETAEVTEGIRSELESQFRSATGLGFKAFDCEYPRGWPASREIPCKATDEEDDRFFYRLLRAEGQNEPRVTMRQPAEQLNPEGLEVLRRPTDAFLLAFMRNDWQAALASLAPSFESQLGLEGVRDILAPVKAEFGTIENSRATYYATPSEGLHQLDYALAVEQGDAIGRFRLRFDAGGNPQIISFLVTAEPGSRLHTRMLESTGKTVLGQFFDQPIGRLEGPLDRLAYIGDHEELLLVLVDGGSVKARVEQHGSTWDMDSNDYRFQVLDARTLIGLHLSSMGRSFASIDCPGDVAPDGGSLDCVVTDPSGSTSTVRLMRRGGEHRLVNAE
jgi:hypothetical protein